jgi:hypothetical protein
MLNLTPKPEAAANARAPRTHTEREGVTQSTSSGTTYRHVDDKLAGRLDRNR